MDLPTRKLRLISYIADIEDEHLLSEIESVYAFEKSKENEERLKPFTKEEFVERIRKSEEDLAKGNFITQEEFEKLSESW